MEVTTQNHILPSITIENRIVYLERYLHSLDALVKDCRVMIPDLRLKVAEKGVLALLDTNSILDCYSDEFMTYAAAMSVKDTILRTDYSSCEELQNISDRVSFLGGDNYGAFAFASRIGGYRSRLYFNSESLGEGLTITHHIDAKSLKYSEYDFLSDEEHDCRKYVTNALARVLSIGDKKEIVPDVGADGSCDDCSYVMIERH